jgi:hypothetical protein
MAKFPKGKILQGFSENLRLFFPHLQNHFMCPLCMRVFDASRHEKEITQAHLIPSAAGGRHSTLACRKCNNHLGANQDKWFGERTRLYKRKEHLFQTRIKNEKFEIDGISVNGHWEMDPEKGFLFQIHPKRNAPHIIRQLTQKFALRPNKITARIELPLAAKDRLTRIGYLTMAYLYWFAFFGYSWVLQKHLDIVREQILHPDRVLINERCFSKFNNKGPGFDLPHFCGAMISGIACVSILFQDVQLYFPSASSPEAYQQLMEFTGDDITTTAEVKFFNLNGLVLDTITGLIYGKLMMIYPDSMPDLENAGVPCSYVTYFDESLPEPSRFAKISWEEARERRKTGEKIPQMRIRRRREPRALLPA